MSVRWLDDPTLDVVRLEECPNAIGWEDENGYIYVHATSRRGASEWIDQYLVDMLEGEEGDFMPDDDELTYGYYKLGPDGLVMPCSVSDDQALLIWTYGG